jgi:hypothetical protein
MLALLSNVDFFSMEDDLDDVSNVAIIDSGASHHLTGERTLLHNF